VYIYNYVIEYLWVQGDYKGVAIILIGFVGFWLKVWGFCWVVPPVRQVRRSKVSLEPHGCTHRSSNYNYCFST